MLVSVRKFQVKGLGIGDLTLPHPSDLVELGSSPNVRFVDGEAFVTKEVLDAVLEAYPTQVYATGKSALFDIEVPDPEEEEADGEADA